MAKLSFSPYLPNSLLSPTFMGPLHCFLFPRWRLWQNCHFRHICQICRFRQLLWGPFTALCFASLAIVAKLSFSPYLPNSPTLSLFCNFCCCVHFWTYLAAVAGVWFTAALSTAITFSPFFLGGSEVTTFYHMQASYYAFLFCCLFIMVVSYTSIAIKVYCGTHPQHHGAIRRERKLTKTLFIVTIVSLILVTPFTICGLYVIVSGGEIFETISYHTRLHLIYSLNCLFYGNSLINPLLYALKMPQFKRALFLLLRCR